MELQGRLSRVHGGAVAKKDMKPFFDLKKAERRAVQAEIGNFLQSDGLYFQWRYHRN